MARLITWNPWSNDDPFTQMINSTRKGLPWGDFGSDDGVYPVSVDLSEDDQHVYAEVHLPPRITADDIDITYEDRYLTISGEKKSKSEENDKKRKYHYKEISEMSFSRTITLPSKIDEDNINAEIEDGILYITMPKAQETKSKKISVSKK